MRFVDASEARVLAAISQLVDTNPFTPERVDCERRVLGGAFVESAAVWHADGAPDALTPNPDRIQERVETLAGKLRHRLSEGAAATPAELVQYEGLVRHLLYYRYMDAFTRLIELGEQGKPCDRRVAGYGRFSSDFSHYLEIPKLSLPFPVSAPELFAWGFQIRRAFDSTYRRIFGGSMPAARLRTAVWESIFTHDPRRFRRSLRGRMGDIPTLITGESGTGKELVARAIGMSRHIPFDPERHCFVADYAKSFVAVNLSALSPTLIESELFGHRRGSFTGAVDDREGWLSGCGEHGTVFIDEVGELDPGIQVKLLRLLQSRRYQRIGEAEERVFEGKIIAATNRNLAEAIASGEFRSDFYYRLCADHIETPPLREQLADQPTDLANLLTLLARRTAGDSEAEALAQEVEGWLGKNLGAAYPWPGNVRELEQCVRSILIRGEYVPVPTHYGAADDPILGPLHRAEISADELLRRYCTQVYAQVGSYEEAARRLGLDRRTVKAKVDSKLLEAIQGSRESREAR
jgi:transcriptional regulator with AAA-type ATPase domain